jgi:hypothetical protein
MAVIRLAWKFSSFVEAKNITLQVHAACPVNFSPPVEHTNNEDDIDEDFFSFGATAPISGLGLPQ